MKISVCIATHNGERYIKAQLESILRQLKPSDEVIVCDDCSQDNTISEINSLNDSRIRLSLNEKRLGYTSNFERTLVVASGDIIFLSDQDDIWLESKVSLSLKALENSDFVLSDCIVVDEKLNAIHESHIKQWEARDGFMLNYLLPRHVGATFAFKRVVLEKSLPFPIRSNLCAHDYWISLIAFLHFRVCIIPVCLILYRRHSSNASTGGSKSRNSFLKKFSIRIYCAVMLARRYF